MDARLGALTDQRVTEKMRASWKAAGLLGACVLAVAAFDAGVPVRVGVPRQPAGGSAGDPASSADPELSFVAPFDLVNSYTGERYVEEWDTGGAAMVHRNFVRLTSDAQGHRGWLINRVPVTFRAWSVLMKFRVSGQSAQLFGDGLALWLVENPDHREGAVFGREDKWNGLAVTFDTFQNLDKSHHQKHPYVSAVLNDGTRHYEPDEGNSPSEAKRGKHVIPGRDEGSGCSFDFRFSEARDDFSVTNGTWAHVVHDGERLRVSLRQSGGSFWTECIDFAMAPLKGEHFFGLSAATGDLVDNHDVLVFDVHGWDRAISVADAERVRARGLANAARSELDVASSATPTADNHLGLLGEQASEIQRLRSTIAVLQHRLEYELSAVRRGVQHAKHLAEHGASRIEALQHEVRQRGASAGPSRATAARQHTYSCLSDTHRASSDGVVLRVAYPPPGSNPLAAALPAGHRRPLERHGQRDGQEARGRG